MPYLLMFRKSNHDCNKYTDVRWVTKVSICLCNLVSPPTLILYTHSLQEHWLQLKAALATQHLLHFSTQVYPTSTIPLSLVLTVYTNYTLTYFRNSDSSWKQRTLCIYPTF